MYNQLASWMIYGIHHDQYGEFFMSRQESRDAEHDSPPDMIERLASTSNSDFLTDWHSCFHISLDTWPEHRPMRVAESILFAGKAVRVLGNSSPAIRIQGATSYQQMSRESQRLQVCTMQNTSTKDSPSENKPIGQELHPQSDADKIENMLQNLKLVVVHAALNGHLKALKDYFLLAKGDFFQSFLGESHQLMHLLPPRQSIAEADRMVPFQLVSLRMSSFGIPIKSSQVDLPKKKAYADGDSNVQLETSLEVSLDGWDGTTLEYSVYWPLQLFFTLEVLPKWM